MTHCPQDRLIAECAKLISEAEAALFHARGALTSLSVASQEARTAATLNASCQLDAETVFTPPKGTCGGSIRAEAFNAPQSSSGNASTVTEKPPSSPQKAEGDANAGGENCSPGLPKSRNFESPYMDQVVLDALNDDGYEEGLMQEFCPPTSGKYSKKKTVTLVNVGGSSFKCLALPVLHPDSRIRVVWDLLGLIFIIYETYAIPFYIAFHVNAHSSSILWLMVCIINSYFIIDIGASFITGYRGELGVVIMMPSKIIRRYSRTWFTPDVIAGIPWEWLEGVLPVSGNAAQMTKMLRLLRVARLLRLLKIDIMSERIKMLVEANPFLVFVSGVLRVLFLLFGITHWAACIWYIIGTRPDETKRWTDAHIPKDADKTESYVYALYFTLTTMTTVGYGDITPSNFAEVSFVSVLLLVATVVFAALMGSLTDLISNLNSEKHIQNERVVMLSRYMTWRSVPRDLFLSIRRHLLYLWETNKGYDAYEEAVKDQLPPVLRKELCFHIYGRILRSMPFLSWMKGYEVCLKELSNIVHPIVYSRGDCIFRVGQENLSIFILLSGTVRISLNENLFGHKLQVDDLDEDSDDHHEKKELDSKLALQLPRGVSFSLSLPSAHSSMKDVDKQKKKEVRNDLIVAKVLQDASQKLALQDQRERWAANVIIRRWKAKAEARNAGDESMGDQMRIRRSKSKSLRATTVTAPAYFGESCLWVPHADWGTCATEHMYNARCESRCELLSLGRGDLQEVLQSFGPWLTERFESFREFTVCGMEAKMGITSEGGAAGKGACSNVNKNGADAFPSSSPRCLPDAVLSDAGIINLNAGSALVAAAGDMARKHSDAGSSTGCKSGGLNATPATPAADWARTLAEPQPSPGAKAKQQEQDRLILQSRSAELASRSRAAASRLMAISMAPNTTPTDATSPPYRTVSAATLQQMSRGKLGTFHGTVGAQGDLRDPLLSRSRSGSKQ